MIFERGDFESKRVTESFVNESLREVKMFSQNKPHSNACTVFISHKHSDLKELQGVMGMLKEFGVKVYIDSMDNKMPNQTSGETAERLKEVIKFCKKFILLATEKAIESYWCNWELGFGDTHKFINHIAILPMKDRNTYDHNYKGNEYLQIYPHIEYRDGTTNYKGGAQIEKGYYIRSPRDKNNNFNITPISDWLNS